MILSIESSCDDSSLALTSIENAHLLYHIKMSQDEAHSNYGGIVPEIASRIHAQRLPQILKKLKKYLKNDLSVIKAIAVTNRPGLSVTLIEGLMMAKALCLGLNIPLICVNHLKGHIYSLFIQTDKISSPKISLPMDILLVSGGHTQILRMQDFHHITIIAQTLDDSFGESFDKVAKYLSFGYPGGAIIEHYANIFAKDYTQDKPYMFPIPLIRTQNLAFSFSGLKNAVRLAIETLPKPLKEKDICSICAGFQYSAIMHIANKVELYFKQKKHSPMKIKYFAIVGGASANKFLRKSINELCKKYDKNLLLAPLAFCSDNAAMIGRIGVEYYKMGEFSSLKASQVYPKSLENDFL